MLMVKTARIIIRKIYISKDQTITNPSNHVSVHEWLIVFKPPYMKGFQSDCTKPLNAKLGADTNNVPFTSSFKFKYKYELFL